jgi:hypothetical protein
MFLSNGIPWACIVTILLAAASALPVLSQATEQPNPRLAQITIKNPSCEAIVLLRPFVRLDSFRLTGCKNYLITARSPNPVVNGHALRPPFIIGAKLWYAPETPGSHLFGLLPGNATENGNKVQVATPPDPLSHLQAKIQFDLDASLPLITITSTILNVGDNARFVSPWWPVSFEEGGQMDSHLIPFGNEPTYRFSSWSYSAPISDPACHISRDHVTLDLNRPLSEPIFKIGFLSDEIEVAKGDCTYHLTVIDPRPSPLLTYPHGGSSSILFRDQRTWFCEAELLGPLVRLTPGQSTSFTFTIYLAKTSHSLDEK